MADAIPSKPSCMDASKRKKRHDSDPGEGTSGSQHHSKRAKVHKTTPHTRASKVSKDEERHHKAIEQAIQKAQLVADKEARSSPPGLPPAIQGQSTPSLSPDVTEELLCPLMRLCYLSLGPV